jgi:hypothetical protein
MASRVCNVSVLRRSCDLWAGRFLGRAWPATPYSSSEAYEGPQGANIFAGPVALARGESVSK